MPSNARARRAPSSPESLTLNNVERLLFAQAVYEYGAESWQEVSRVLSKHPMVSRSKGFFTPQTCPVIYAQLMEEAGLECPENSALPKAPEHLNLARRHYQARMLELRELIAAEEAKFKTIVNEIDEIRSGLWDHKIREKLGMLPQPSAASPPTEQPSVEEPQHSPPPVDADNADIKMETRHETPQPEEYASQGLARASSVPQASEEHINVEEERIEEERVEEEIPIPMVVEDLVESRDDVEAAMEEQQPADARTEEVPPPATEETDVRAGDVEISPTVEDEVGGQEQDLTEDVDIPHVEEQHSPRTPSPEQISVPSSPEKPLMELAQEAELYNAAPPDESSDQVQAVETSRSEGKRKASEVESPPPESQRERKRQREDTETLAEEEDAQLAVVPAMPSPRPATQSRRAGRPPGTDTPAVSKRFQNMITMLHSQISQHRNGNIFHNPIRKIEAPDYHDIVKRPMDLKTVKARIKDGLISNSLEFQRDVYLMFANAMMYNRPGSEIYNMAEEMMLASEIHINTFRQTEGFHRL
ncbi:hypothetical protein WOLCODRAFT_16834 [Wolfiporia cocos MD-104 SS10]|uniref:Bromo domain-containing protein n=1 Tax=Wolfiporia cocos (strain MD-104) TaxID=742152 RepID=A0A2H3JGJ6_WOLCO|nr:hypothetical protein WOLCODRAFT_16834 [Wolfiporia cocos MD-104 SS10]